MAVSYFDESITCFPPSCYFFSSLLPIQGFTSLHLACRGGHSPVAGLLLSRSTILLVTEDKHGRTPLHIAAAHGHDRLAELLLGQGADINVADKVYITAHNCHFLYITTYNILLCNNSPVTVWMDCIAFSSSSWSPINGYVVVGEWSNT